MARTKTEFKWFTIHQYKTEEEYLRNMHNSGWKLTRLGFPGFYHFTECTPEDVVYQLDYNLDGNKNKSEYIQMFSDLGWEYLLDYTGYSYFRKPVQQMDGDEEIFCDDESRLEMMKRVFKGRVWPLLILFFAIVLPQLFMQSTPSHGNTFFAVAFLILFLLYLFIFILFGFHFFSYEKKIREPDKAFRTKYIILSIITLVLCVFVALGMIRLWIPGDSKYTIHAQSDQYSVGAEFLNETLSHELLLQEGEQLDLSFVITDGQLHVSVGLDGEDAIYEGTNSESFSCTLGIHKTGNYKILITGSEAEGSFLFQVR